MKRIVAIMSLIVVLFTGISTASAFNKTDMNGKWDFYIWKEVYADGDLSGNSPKWGIVTVDIKDLKIIHSDEGVEGSVEPIKGSFAIKTVNGTSNTFYGTLILTSYPSDIKIDVKFSLTTDKLMTVGVGKDQYKDVYMIRMVKK